MTRNYQFLKLFSISILIGTLGCSDDDVIQKPGNLLVANAGNDQAIHINETIILDGSASYSKDEKPFSFQWSLKSKPGESIASIGNSSSGKATFTPDKAGLYIIQLLIRREGDSSTDEVKLTVTEGGAGNPQTILLTDDIDSNTTLHDIFEDPSKPDYRVTKDIAVRADLLITPGVVIEFEENTSLQIVTGSLHAEGAEGNEVVFKGSQSIHGFWKGIFIDTNNNLNELKHAVITGGGSIGGSLNNAGANLTLIGDDHSGAALNISHTSFNNSGGYGLFVQGMSTINNFSNNSFFDNAQAATYIPARQLHQLDIASFMIGDGEQQVIETGGYVEDGQELVWKKLVYNVTSNITVRAGVTVSPGAHLKFSEGTSLAVMHNGYLDMIGNETARILLGALNENTYWDGLYFNSQHEKNNIEYSEISNAGASRILDAEHAANIYLGMNAKLKIENSIIKNGLGYGIAVKYLGGINENVVASNTFINLQKGNTFPSVDEDLTPVTGVWLDQWSFFNGVDALTPNFYDVNGQTWFDGAGNPWAMSEPGFGIQIEDSGNFSWLIAEHSPMTGCESYSAEFITGRATISPEVIRFQQDYWRSKFVNKCDETQNVDTDVTPFDLELSYSIRKMNNVQTGEEYWELTFTNPDQSVFKFYRR